MHGGRYEHRTLSQADVEQLAAERLPDVRCPDNWLPRQLKTAAQGALPGRPRAGQRTAQGVVPQHACGTFLQSTGPIEPPWSMSKARRTPTLRRRRAGDGPLPRRHRPRPPRPRRPCSWSAATPRPGRPASGTSSTAPPTPRRASARAVLDELLGRVEDRPRRSPGSRSDSPDRAARRSSPTTAPGSAPTTGSATSAASRRTASTPSPGPGRGRFTSTTRPDRPAILLPVRWLRGAEDYAFFDNGGRPLAMAHRGGALTGTTPASRTRWSPSPRPSPSATGTSRPTSTPPPTGCVIAFHDATLDRVTDLTGSVAELPYERRAPRPHRRSRGRPAAQRASSRPGRSSGSTSTARAGGPSSRWPG